MVASLHKHATIELMSIGIIVLMVAIRQVFPAHDIVGRIGYVAEVVAVEIL